MKDATIQAAVVAVTDHAMERKILYGLILLGLAYGGGFWNGTRICRGMGEAEKRQLQGQLTAKEQEIAAGNAALGKVQTDLKTSQEVQAQLQASNSDLATKAAGLERQYGLVAGQFASLSAWVQTTLKNGKSGDLPGPLAGSATPECGACKGSIAFGGVTPFARCSWADYSAARSGIGGSAGLDLNLGVKVDTVTMRQKPQDGSLEAVLGKVFITDSSGVVLAEGHLDEKSRVFTAAQDRGDLLRRHIWLIGGLGDRGARIGFITQRGVRPWGYGINATRDLNGRWGGDAVLSFQIR